MVLVRGNRNFIGLILLLVIPFQGIAQDTLDVGEVRIIANDLYKTLYDTIRVQDTTFTTVYDTTFVTDSTFVTVYDTSQVVDSVYTLVKNEAPTLRNVWWQHRREAGERYNYFDIRGESTADSLVFTWSGEDIKKKTLFPDSAFTVTVKTQYLGQAEYAITGYDSLWTITNTDIINTALMDTLGGQTSITDIEVMALADTPYITVPWSTTPGSDLTDYVGYYDLSNAPQSWWDAVDTADLGKARVAKDDAAANATTATELAFEMTDIDTVNQTGRIWFRWSGTLPATSPDDVRIYAPQASYTSYGVTDTFGSEAVWVNYFAVYHLEEDPSGTAPQMIDATGNGHDLTVESGAPASIAGKIGQAVNNNGGYFGSGAFPATGSGNRTTTVWAKTTATTRSRISGYGDTGSGKKWGIRYDENNNNSLRVEHGGGFITATTAINDGSYHHLAVVLDGSTLADTKLLIDGAEETVSASSGTGVTIDTAATGVDLKLGTGIALINTWPDDIDEYRFSLSAIPTDFIALEYANQNDPATFWGTPTFVAAGGGGTSISGSPDEMSVSTSLDQFAGVLHAVGSPNEMSLSVSLDSFSGVINAVGSPSGMSVSVSMDELSGVLHAVGSPDDMSVATLLDQMSVNITGSPDPMSVATSLDSFSGIVTFVGSPEDMAVATSLDEFAGSIVAVGSLNDMSVATTLGEIAGTITVVGSLDDMSVATFLDDVIGGTQGDATKMNISADELYLIELSTKTLYKVTLQAKPQYNITLNAEEVIE